METMNTYTAYHATDKNNIKSIMHNGFKYNHRDYHWLGNGVYFFLDKALAVKWGQNASFKYGKINEYAVLKVIIETEDQYICDMRILETYCSVKKYFDQYMKIVHSVDFKKTTEKDFYTKLRCSFFDWLIKEFNIKCIIAYFSERRNTLPIKINDEKTFAHFQIPYIEVQACITDTTCIVNKEVI